MIKNLLIIFLISLSLVYIWFKEGQIMGTAEAVLPFYNLERYFHLTEFAWTFHPGLGNIAGTTVASKPTYFLLSMLQNSGIPGYLLQAITFLFILLSAGIGMYFFTKEIFPKLPNRYYLISALFYLFNPISIVNVWNRFLFNFMFFYALLPLGVFIFIKGLNEKKYYYAILFPVTLGIFSYAFSAITFVFLLWVIVGIFSLFYFISHRDLKDKLFVLKYFFLSLSFFLIVNSWYLSQLLNLTAPISFERDIRTFHPQQININTLNSLSQKMGNLSDLYRLNNAWFFREVDLEWVKPYETFPIILISFLTTAITLFGILKGRQQKGILLLGFVFFTALFLSKGSNPPLGFIYQTFFEHLPFLQVFRNPIEKFSFILVLAYAPLLAAGFYYLSNSVSKKVITFLALLTLSIWAYPFFTGLVFTSQTPPNNNPNIGFKVEVPDYYEEANKFLENHGNNFRVIGFPVADEGITYNWNKGYQGADIPSTLFSMPVIFFNTTVPFYYNLVKEIEPNLNDEHDFSKVANFLNVRFFFVRADVDFQKRNLTNPKEIEELLAKKETKGEIKKAAEFGKLKIWENKSWIDKTFYAAGTLIATNEAKLQNLKNLKPDEALIEGGNSFNGEGGALPALTYQKINPSTYNVQVKNSTTPFILVFSETYNPNWQVTAGNEIIKNHFRVNIYANAWEIDKPGSYDLEIKFTPQNWLEISEKISLAGFIAGCIYLVVFRKEAFKK